ncbi:MAG TPA: tetratricopeptide repeat protein [Clostridia bacterium]|nr:tetratricopeptide repeat protein [Clostridia bacterium]
MRTRILFCSLAVVVLSVTFACSRHKQLERAEQLEKKGQFALALDAYKAEIADTAASDTKRLSELYYRSGECLLALERPADAFSAYNKAVELNDHNQSAHLRLGELYLLAGSGDRATEQASAALKSSGANLDALALLGAAAAANGQTDIARDAFTRVLTADPGRVKVALSLSDLYQHDNQTEQARDVLRKAAQAQPLSAMPWLALGRLEEQEGNVKIAEDAYRKAVAAENTPESNLRLAQYLERAGRVAEAEQILKRVDSLRPKLPTALPDFHLISGKAGRASEAYLIALRTSVAADQASGPIQIAQAKETRGQLISRLIEADLAAGAVSDQRSSRHAESGARIAREHLTEFRRELDAATIRLLEAEISIAENDLPMAKVQAEAAVEMAPESAAAHYVLGVVKYRSGDPSGARTDWDAALEEDSRFIPARLALAGYTLNSGDFAAAQDYVVPAVREEPGNFEALILFARVLVAEKNYASARIISHRAQVVDPTSAEPHLINGQIALEEDKIGESLIQFQQAVLLEPRSRSAIEGLTKVYRSGMVTRPMLLKMETIASSEPRSATLMEITGRLFAERSWTEDARRCLQRSLEIDPNRPSAATALAQIFAADGEVSAATDSAARVGDMRTLLNGVRAQDRQDMQSAIANYEAAVRAGDKTGVAANNLAWIYAEQGSNLDRALTLAQRARELAPASAGVLDTLGYVYLKRREYTQAVAVLERAHVLAKTQARDGAAVLGDIKRHLAEAYLRNGQTEQAALVASNRGAALHK